MAVPRPILLAVLGLLLVFATLMASLNAHKASEASPAPSKPTAVKSAPKPEPKPKAKSAAKDEHPAAKPAEKHSSATASHKQQARPRHHAAVSTPAAVKKAIAADHVVVLAFFQKRGADDRATRVAVKDVKRRHLARVYMDIIDHVGRYGTVVGSLGIHQAPAVVIIDAKHKARLVEGYVDAESLAQEVSDARK
jgi:hypothetical protein